jgi:predicted NBD/HSP70 family sugar kinase
MAEMLDVFVGANAERSRSHNRKLVLGRLRATGESGRAQIARASGLSIQAVSNIIAGLMDDGLIVEQGRKATGRGQPPVLYALNPQGAYALGIEVRPDAVNATVLDLCGTPLASARRALAAADLGSVRSCVQDARDAVLRTASISASKLLGAGIVMPGPFGVTGITGSGSDLPLWDDIAPGPWFSEALSLPVAIENDANAAAIAERVCGVAQGLETYAFLYFGQGLGLGIVSGGRLMTGAFGNAGEIGHVRVPSGGGVVALEDVVSRLSVQRALGAAGLVVANVDDLARLHDQRAPPLLEWIDAAVGPLAAAVTLIENIFDPQTVILGGAMPDVVLDHFRAAVPLSDRSVSNRDLRAHPRLMRGASGRMTATLGAAALVLNRAFTPEIAVLS